MWWGLLLFFVLIIFHFIFICSGVLSCLCVCVPHACLETWKETQWENQSTMCLPCKPSAQNVQYQCSLTRYPSLHSKLSSLCIKDIVPQHKTTEWWWITPCCHSVLPNGSKEGSFFQKSSLNHKLLQLRPNELKWWALKSTKSLQPGDKIYHSFQ